MRIDTPAGPLHAVTDGPADGPTVILLHGFPEFWYGWRKQIPALAAAGFRVIVPDQRGYNNSAKPTRVMDYSIGDLTADVLRTVDNSGQRRVHLIGHDWGGIVAWHAAYKHPDRIARLVILNAPHPAVAQRYLMSNPRQMLRSWYIAFFQLPWLPERSLTTAALVGTSRKGAFTAEDLGRYEAAWDKTGARRSMINWYRALARTAYVDTGRIAVPTRIIWGARDRFLLREMASDSVRLCDRGDLVEIAEATHWLHHEEPEVVNRLILRHLQAALLPRRHNGSDEAPDRRK